MHLQDDYRLIIPDIRGFGASTHPGDVQSSGSMPDLVEDIMCILQHASVSQAVVIGQVSLLALVVSDG
jgi:soluble epoxide hydrolase / lipid-phosphate phosphatase